MVPHKTPYILQIIMPSRLWRVKTHDKELYLTFDDGPIPLLTEWVLDVLKEKEVCATFFCVGANIDKHPEIFKRILKEGHSVGNHTYNHLNGWDNSLNSYIQNIEHCQSVIEKHQGQTDLFRPPYGRLKYQQKKRISDYRVVMWDVLSKDYLSHLAKETVLNESIKATENGSIIVFHDNIKAEANLRYSLPRYIDHFHARGYEFKGL